MADSAEGGQKSRRWLRPLLAAIAVLLLALLLPPFISVNHYKSRVTSLISRSLGRPVRLSNVGVRILPRPGFVLNDLSVAEDPAYGTEPVMHANNVNASIRLLALLKGRIEIGTISVNEATLNLVRAGPGRWNLDALFRNAAEVTEPHSGAAASVALPTLDATDLRIDFKNGVEKLPFSLVNADLTVWQQNPGEWRVRMRGQPARTDVSLSLEDTGLLRMEASVRRGPTLRQMPAQLDLEWREAQLGQLARLLTGSDSGWRGDLTGQVHVDGSADAARVAVRLRASGVHREEFTPASTLDFDANCNFLYQYTQRNLENLVCDSPLGDGRVHLTGEKPGAGAPSFALELNRIPVAAGLDALRTLRNGLAPDFEAAGEVSGKLVYAEKQADAADAVIGTKNSGGHSRKPSQEDSGPLSGSLTVENLVLTGGGLTRPIQTPRFTLAPASTETASIRQSPAVGVPPDADHRGELTGTVAIPAGGTVPLTLTLRFSLSGYQVAARGQAGIARAREIAHAAGIQQAAILGSLAGEPLDVDVAAQGPWLLREEFPLSETSPPQMTPGLAVSSVSSNSAEPGPDNSDALTGTVTVHNANWKADYLASHLQVADATLHLDAGALRWDPVDFSYGPVKGTATLMLPRACPPEPEQLCPTPLPPTFSVAFGDLDAVSLETALLGAHKPGTLLSTLIDRFHPSTAPPWPQVRGTVNADSLVLGPVTLEKFAAGLEIRSDEVDATNLEADLLGGHVKLTGTLHKPATDQDKPSYSLEGDFENLDAKALGQLLGLRWTGSSVSGNGKVDLAGYTASDLASSAKGTLHFETRYGNIAPLAKPQGEGETEANQVLEALGRFDRFTADAIIADGAVTLGPNQLISTGRKRSVAATVTLADPPVVSFEAAKPSVANR